MIHNSPPNLGSPPAIWRLDDTPTSNADEGPIALLRSITTLALQYRLTLIACTAAGLGIAAVYAKTLPPVFTATSTLLLEARRQAAASNSDLGASQNLDLNRVDSELQIIRSERLLSVVFNSLDLENKNAEQRPPRGRMDRWIEELLGMSASVTARLGLTTGGDTLDRTGRATMGPAPSDAVRDTNARQMAFESFAKLLSARRVGQSYVIEISYTSSDPALTARVANAAVSAYLLQSVSFKAQMARAGADVFQSRLDALAMQVEAATAATKQGELPRISIPDADARVIGAAIAPLTPSGPRTSLITILGGVLGLIGALFTLALNVGLDRKVRSVRQLSRDTGLPCFAVIPKMFRRRAPFSNAFSTTSQAQRKYAVVVRDLRTAFETTCSSVRKERNLVMAVVSVGGFDVSTLCMSLATHTWNSGRYVTLFSRETPRTGSTASVSDMLIANIPPEKAAFETQDGVAVLPILSSNADTNLYVDLHDPRVARLIEAARAKGYVVLDLPMLGASMDALALAVHADAVLISCCVGVNTREEVSEAMQQLRRAGVNVIGTVINQATR